VLVGKLALAVFIWGVPMKVATKRLAVFIQILRRGLSAG
jgi:hypothetical protein